MGGHYNQDTTINLYTNLAKFNLEIKLKMSESNNLPQSISHRKLSHFLSNAKKEKYFLDKNSCNESKEKEELLAVINEWENISQKVINKVKSKNINFLDQEPSSSLIALGAFEAHVNMALYALKEFNKNQE